MLVLDASVTLAWGLPDEQSEYADAVLSYVAQSRARVPSIWTLEVLNGVLMAERAKRFTFDDAQEFLTQIRKLHRRRRLMVASVAPDQAFVNVATLAREHRLTAYDASYMHLAHTERLPLASIDEKLKKAAQKLGVPLWSPPKP
jgi:predicted nucleic acid-binding protein